MKFLSVLGALLLGACHSSAITNGAPAPDETEAGGTKVIVSEATDAAVPDCTIHLVSAAFTGEHATKVGAVKIEGDYTRTLAKVEVTRGGAAGHPTETAWSGTFNGPRDALFETLRRHVCTAPRVYALAPEGNKDPTKGAVLMDVWEMTPDEKADVENMCNALAHADAGANADARDHAVMAYVEDTTTTTKWDAWRRSFARERGESFANKSDPKPLFHARGAELAAAAQAIGVASCPLAADWKKR
ncbi:MAG TPA: hypothetical protein VGH28_05095 [Polyangiaceae bacterium]